MTPFTELPDDSLFTVSGLSTVYRRVSADEIRIHGLPPKSWLSKRRISPVPGLLVQIADSTRVEVESQETVEKCQESVTRTIPKRAAVKRLIPKRREGVQ